MLSRDAKDMRNTIADLREDRRGVERQWSDARSQSPSRTPSSVVEVQRWAAAVQRVKKRNGLLAEVLHSATFLGVSDDGHLRVAFTTDFNKRTVEKSSNRALIEAEASAEFGRTVRLEATSCVTP